MSLRATINRWRGKVPPVFERRPVSVLTRDWSFHASSPPAGARAIRAHAVLLDWRAKPPSAVIKPVYPAPAWSCYFVFTPDGKLNESHLFTLSRLRAMKRPLLVVCAAPSAAGIPPDLADHCDALVWKGLRGFDFSAYRLGLQTVAVASPGADVFVMNDSVMGPFSDLDPILAGAQWDLTGFTAHSLIENHIQSYAFQLRDVTAQRLRGLAAVMPPVLAFDDYRSVIYMQETRFARTASKRMSVGSFWYAHETVCGDPTIFAGPALLESGFPFLKKSLFGRNDTIYDPAMLVELLAERGHPPPSSVRKV